MELPLPDTNPDTNAVTIYDVAVIGGGPAGYTAAIRGAEYGLNVALIDASPKLGGLGEFAGRVLWTELDRATRRVSQFLRPLWTID